MQLPTKMARFTTDEAMQLVMDSDMTDELRSLKLKITHFHFLDLAAVKIVGVRVKVCKTYVNKEMHA